MSKLKAVLFDLDGTLLDSIPGILASFEYTLDQHLPGHGYTRHEMTQTIGEPLPAQMLQFARGDASKVADLVATYRAHNVTLVPGFPLFPGVVETLTALRERGFKTGLVTSKYRMTAQISLDAHQLGKLFDLVLTADDTPKHKPDPMPLLAAAEKLALNPADIAYVGDSTHDMNCALSAGARAYAALWGPFDPQSLRALRPHGELVHLLELLNLPEFARADVPR